MEDSTTREKTPFTVVTKVSVTKAPENGEGNEDGREPRDTDALHGSTESLALYEEDMGVMQTLAGFLRTFTLPGSEEKEAGDGAKKRAKLGAVLGVYLPTIQHIFGIIMFLRLAWIVGSMGVIQSFVMVFICCLCTFLTCISMSAIATNGVVESGGSYFMISRNLGPEFGSAVGILFYLANSVATSMYLIGGVEILLTYLAPGLPQFKSADGSHGGQAMFNNFRVYATGLLVIEFSIVALGVKFVQGFAPVSLSCVIISILSIFVGSFTATPENSPQVCMLGNRLLQLSTVTINETYTCNKTELSDFYCPPVNGSTFCDSYFLANNVSSVAGIPGIASGVIKENLWPHYLKHDETTTGVLANKGRDIFQDLTTNFFVLLAIYFPSVTGIMTGSNMSGDLKDPQKSIPVGTIAAQLTTSFVYLSFVLVFGSTLTGPVLRDKYGMSMPHGMSSIQMAWPSHWVLLIGSFTSTFGAALQCLCSAPRLLQSIAKDDVIPFLAVFRSVNKRGEPLRALLVTTAIAECAILIGAIDYIAPVVDFFFLMCYGFVNIVCALQTLLRSPNWRPRFHFYHWTLSLLGAALCIFIMFATYWYYAIVTLLLCAGIYKYVEYNGAEKEWGDGIRGLALTGARYSLLKVDDDEPHTKNWRPQILILTKLSEELTPKYQKLVGLVGQLKAGKGLVVCASLLEGDYSDPHVREQSKEVRKSLKQAMKVEKLKGFAQSVICNEFSEGVSVLIQSIGVGALRPNTVIVGWPYAWREEMNNQSYYDFLDAIHRVATADMCLLIPKGIAEFPDKHTKVTGTIDIWWIMHDGGLLILLPFLLKKHKVWRHCKIRVYAVATQFDNNIMMKECLNKWIYQLRIDAEVTVVELPGKDVTAYIHQKTIQMEQRSQFLRDLHLSKKDMVMEPQAVLDDMRRKASTADHLDHNPVTITCDDVDGGSSGKVDDSSIQMDSIRTNEYTFSPSALADLKRAAEANSSPTSSSSSPSSPSFQVDPAGNLMPGSANNREEKKPNRRYETDSKTTKKMHNALKLNLAIKETSSEAELVIINLPGLPKNKASLTNYMDYLEAMTEGLERVLLVRGTGREVITMYS